MLPCKQSAVDVAFWAKLGSLKLNTLRLSEEPVTVHGALVAWSACCTAA